MIHIGSFAIGDNVVFSIDTHAPATGAFSTADAEPSYSILEETSTGYLLTGTIPDFSTATYPGLYLKSITLNTTDGFENYKNYSIRCTAAVSGTTAAITYHFNTLSKVNAYVVGDTSVVKITSTELTTLSKSTELAILARTTDLSNLATSAELTTLAKSTDVSDLFNGIVADTTSVLTSSITRDAILIGLYQDAFAQRGASTSYNELYNFAGTRIATQSITDVSTLATRGEITNV